MVFDVVVKCDCGRKQALLIVTNATNPPNYTLQCPTCSVVWQVQGQLVSKVLKKLV